MDKEKKSISRSIRMTPTVYSIVDKFNGNGFNEKFENLVLYCQKEEKKIKKAINELQKNYNLLIERKNKEIDHLNKEIDDKRTVLKDLDNLALKIKDIESLINKITSV